MPARCTAAALLALSASLQPPVPRRTHLRHASTDDAALLDAYRAEIAPDAADDWWREFVATRSGRRGRRCAASTPQPPRRCARHGVRGDPLGARPRLLVKEEPKARGARRGRLCAGGRRDGRRRGVVAGRRLRRRVVAVDACCGLAEAIHWRRRCAARARTRSSANEPSSSRLGALVANAVRCGVGPWLRCTRTTGQKLFAALPKESADLILLDAPCSATRSRGGRAGPREASPGPARRRLDEGDRRDAA